MGDLDNEANRTLWAGNLHENVTEDMLYELFLQAGPLDRVKLPKGKNYSFIVFQHEVSVQYTMQLMEGVKLFDRPIKLQFRSQSTNANSQMTARANSSMDPHGHQRSNTPAENMVDPRFQRSFSSPSFLQHGAPHGMSRVDSSPNMPGMSRMDTYPSSRTRSRFDEAPHHSPHGSGYNSPSYGEQERWAGRQPREDLDPRDERRVERMQHDIQKQLSMLGNMSNQQQYTQQQAGHSQSPWQQRGHRGYY